VHAYSDEQVRTLPRLAHELLGLPVDLTEWNAADPELVAAEVRAHPWLRSACYCILAGPEDQRRSWLVEQPNVLAAFRRAQAEPSAISRQPSASGQQAIDSRADC
jgi:hypothetical protein